jgi:hypothetical protein
MNLTDDNKPPFEASKNGRSFWGTIRYYMLQCSPPPTYKYRVMAYGSNSVVLLFRPFPKHNGFEYLSVSVTVIRTSDKCIRIIGTGEWRGYAETRYYSAYKSCREFWHVPWRLLEIENEMEIIRGRVQAKADMPDFRKKDGE